jgi:hypothetical protein
VACLEHQKLALQCVMTTKAWAELNRSVLQYLELEWLRLPMSPALYTPIFKRMQNVTYYGKNMAEVGWRLFQKLSALELEKY